MDVNELRQLGVAQIDFRGHSIDVVPSNADKVLGPGLSSPMTWGLRVGSSPAQVVGYIDAETAGVLYTYDRVSLKHGLGQVCVTLNEAIHAILDEEYPLPARAN